MSSSATKVVLVVEDDESIRRTLQELLEDEGYTVRTATDGVEALDTLQRDGAPGMILLDLMMPRIDGFQFREEQLAQGLHVEVPVVVMSAHARMQSEADKLAARTYLKKPLSIDSLLDAVAGCFTLLPSS